MASDGANLIFGNNNAPDGSQVAVIQGTGSMTQNVTVVAGTYNVSFLAAQRANDQAVGQQIEVVVNNQQVGVIAPVGTGYRLYETQDFTLPSGTYTVQFIGLNPKNGDSTALLDEMTMAPVSDTVVDGGFETPILVANTYQTAPSGTSWQFSGTAGISTNGSTLTSNNVNTPAGRQVGFITNGGSISQTIYLDPGAYDLSFLAVQRVGQKQSQQIQVSVDGQVEGLITPVNSNFNFITNATSPPTYTEYENVEFHDNVPASRLARHDRVPGNGPVQRPEHGLH